MVEITPIFCKWTAVFALVLGAAGWAEAQEPAPVPTATATATTPATVPAAEKTAAASGPLEENPRYRALIEEDKRLQAQEDSLNNVMHGLRRQLREQPEERAHLASEILQMENRLFDLRNAKGRVVNQINALEQEWVLAQLNEPAAPKEPARPDPTLPKEGPARVIPDLVRNDIFPELLPTEEYNSLLTAQRLEPKAEALAEAWIENHRNLTAAAESYRTTTNEQKGPELYVRCQELLQQSTALSDSLATVWDEIFNNKSYTYGYLLDRLNDEALLSEGEDLFNGAMRRLAEVQGQVASEQVADYFLRRQALLQYEIAIARRLELETARDSLVGVKAHVEAVEFRKPKVEIRERMIFDYEPVVFPETQKYNSRSPIPPCKVYERGTIYRILLGTFSGKRSVSTFRGAYPIFYLIDEQRKVNYYAGGYATMEEAMRAVGQLKERGFLDPQVVVWVDGVVSNLSNPSMEQELPEPQTLYRVEILNKRLSDEVRETIESIEGITLSKTGPQHFIVGPFRLLDQAEALATKLAKMDVEMEIKVTEMTQDSK